MTPSYILLLVAAWVVVSFLCLAIRALNRARHVIADLSTENERLRAENRLLRARSTIPPAWTDGRGSEAQVPVQLVNNLPRLA